MNATVSAANTALCRTAAKVAECAKDEKICITLAYGCGDIRVYNLFAGKRVKRIIFASDKYETLMIRDLSGYMFVGAISGLNLHFHNIDENKYGDQFLIHNGYAIWYEFDKDRDVDFITTADDTVENLAYTKLEFEDGSYIEWVRCPDYEYNMGGFKTVSI